MWLILCRYGTYSGARHVVVLVPDGDVISTVDEHAGRSLGQGEHRQGVKNDLPRWYKMGPY